MRWDSTEGSDPWKTQDRLGHDVTIMRNAKPDSIAHECEQSLKRLGVDVIDLYQVHWPDTSTPVEDTMAALVKLQEQGKVRAVGVSNYDANWIKRAAAVGTVASLQPPYSLVQRKIEKEILPTCRELNIGLIVYSPMERGLLTGSVPPDRVFPPGDHRASHKFFTPENRRRVLDSLDKVRPIAEEHGVSLGQMVINWTIQVPGITAAIVGARNAEQAEQNARALSFQLSPEECAEIRQVFDETSAKMMGS